MAQESRMSNRDRMKRHLMAQRARSGYRFQNPKEVGMKYQRPPVQPGRSPAVGREAPFSGRAGGGQSMVGPMSGGSSNGPGFNDALNRAIPGAAQGSNPGRVAQFAINNAGRIGTAVGQATGVPGLGLVGRALNRQYWQNNQWQNPADNLPPSGNDQINQAVASNPSSAESLRELAGGRQNAAGGMEYYGTLGAWHGFRSPGGGIKWIHSRSLNNDN